MSRLAGVAGLLLALVAAPVLSPASASAAACKTRGHAYLISLPSGTVHFSGYEGDRSAGVGVWTTRRDEQFQLGGNGIRKDTTITWSAKSATGQSFGFNPQPPNKANKGCVVNQSPPTYFVDAPPGFYEIYAHYTAGNSGWTGDDLVTYARVVP